MKETSKSAEHRENESSGNLVEAMQEHFQKLATAPRKIKEPEWKALAWDGDGIAEPLEAR